MPDWFLNGIHFSRRVKCQLKMTNVQCDQASAERKEMLKILRNHPQRALLNNP
jgi:hypothetical protein